MIAKNVEWDQPAMTNVVFHLKDLVSLPQTSDKCSFYNKHSNLRL